MKLGFFLMGILACLSAFSLPLGQLPDDVIPVAYRLHLNIDPTLDHFSGTIEIDLQIKRSLKSFWLHGKDLRVSSVQLLTSSKANIGAHYEQRSPDGVSQITLEHEIDAGLATLTIQYSAGLNTNLSGLYKVKVGRQSYAYTQFEPIAARQCFPGFDEPRFKTPFTVDVTTRDQNVVISNSPLNTLKLASKGQIQFQFQTTKPLPTYLVAIMVGPFDVVTGKSPIPLRGVATKGNGKHLRYALNHTPRILKLIENYVGSPYPYEKLDIIAVPDFKAGAMENPGAITFRDSLLWIDPKTAPAEQIRAFNSVMTHELVHQWFGNLVTMAWWDDLWLNESFATWLSAKIVDRYRPSDQSLMDQLADSHDAMHEDSLSSARQIQQPIKSIHDIHDAFDSITYAKGAAVLRMFEHVVGETAFQAGIRNYLNHFKWGNATADDFISAISQSSGQNIHPSFRSFLTQPGVPLINIDWKCDDGLSTLIVSQSRYLPLGSRGSPKQSWPIPLCSKYRVNQKIESRCDWIDGETSRVEFRTSVCPTWFLPNHQASGYYRWKLARPQTANLINARHELSQFEQLALTDSLSAGFYSGAYSFDDVSDWLMRFTDSPNRYVATSVFPIMEFAKSHLLTGSRRETVLSKAAARFRPILLQPIDVLFRHELLSFLAFVVEDPQTRSNLSVIGRLNLHKRDNYNIASIALGVLAQDHSSNVVTLSNQLTSSTSPIDRQTILSAISRVGRAHADVFYDILLGSSLKKSERLHLLVQHASHDPNSGPAWLWLQNHWDDYLSLLPNEVKGALPAVASSLCQMSDRESVQAFFATHDIKDFSGGPRSLSEAMEQIDLCSAIRNYSLLAQ